MLDAFQAKLFSITHIFITWQNMEIWQTGELSQESVANNIIWFIKTQHTGQIHIFYVAHQNLEAIILGPVSFD